MILKQKQSCKSKMVEDLKLKLEEMLMDKGGDIMKNWVAEQRK